MTIKEMFFTRPPPTPVLPAVQQLDRFLNSIREKNALVLGENWRNLMSYTEARNRFETGRLNTDSRTSCGTAIGQVSKLDPGEKRVSPRGKTGGI